ncbi:hypothetical protein Ancab_008790 [Ancistrocladus abbreviatus]
MDMEPILQRLDSMEQRDGFSGMSSLPLGLAGFCCCGLNVCEKGFCLDDLYPRVPFGLRGPVSPVGVPCILLNPIRCWWSCFELLDWRGVGSQFVMAIFEGLKDHGLWQPTAPIWFSVPPVCVSSQAGQGFLSQVHAWFCALFG